MAFSHAIPARASRILAVGGAIQMSAILVNNDVSEDDSSAAVRDRSALRQVVWMAGLRGLK